MEGDNLRARRFPWKIWCRTFKANRISRNADRRKLANSTKTAFSNCISFRCTPYFVFQLSTPFIDSYDCSRTNERPDQREFSNKGHKCLPLSSCLNSFAKQKAGPDLSHAMISFDAIDAHRGRTILARSKNCGTFMKSSSASFTKFKHRLKIKMMVKEGVTRS